MGRFIGAPGTLKSPSMERIIRPLFDLEAGWEVEEAEDAETVEYRESAQLKSSKKIGARK